MASKIRDIKEIRIIASIGLGPAKQIADFYGSRYGVYNEPLQEWEKELMKPPKPNWKLDIPWIVGYTRGPSTYTQGRFPSSDGAADFQRFLLEHRPDHYDGTFIRFDIEES